MTAAIQDQLPTTPAAADVLNIDQVSVRFRAGGGTVHALREVSLSVRQHEVLGVVGESGSGKSSLALAVMGLLPPNATVSGSISLRGDELVGRSEKAMESVRGARLGIVFQDPLASLNPVYTVGYQIAEALLAHQQISKAAAHRRAVELLDLVGISNPERRSAAYPHEFSGGMRQRAVIAIAIANEPDVLILDEPTTALDVTIQAQVLQALSAVRATTDAAQLLITHDLGVIAGQADRVVVLYAGRVVETAQVDELFAAPAMPYTLGLLGSLPRLANDARGRLTPIPGSPPSLLRVDGGCPFAPRCPAAQDICRSEEPSLRPVTATGHLAACHFASDIRGRPPEELFPPLGLARALTSDPARPAATAVNRLTILQARNVVKHFPARGGRRGLRPGHDVVHAVCGVDLDLVAGETTALVGESGSGKSTLGRLLMNLLPPTSGEIAFRGASTLHIRGDELRRFRRATQLVFQDPTASLDPRMTAADLIAEPLRLGGAGQRTRLARAEELIQAVGLRTAHLRRYPHEFSGGQRQRVSIARALSTSPELMILDEPVSSLDVSAQAGIINLLQDLQDTLKLSYLLISHDIALVNHVATRVAVMYLGRIVEVGERQHIFSRPAHPYTHALISAVPVPDPGLERQRPRRPITGDIPNPVDPPSGCRFRTRCPRFASELTDAEQAKCRQETPQLIRRDTEQPVACHFPQTLQIL
jgi:peptide/nickel transport system ATP-binding protein